MIQHGPSGRLPPELRAPVTLPEYLTLIRERGEALEALRAIVRLTQNGTVFEIARTVRKRALATLDRIAPDGNDKNPPEAAE